MNRNALIALTLLAFGAGSVAPPAEAGRKKRGLARKAPKPPRRAALPTHPDQLSFPDLKFDAPERLEHRHVLDNGVVVYVVEDHALPLVDVDVTVRGGSYLDPEGKEGLASMTAQLMRSGGAGELGPSELDEELDFLAVNLGVSGGDRTSSASLNVLTKDLDRGLDLLFDVLREPRFDADRLELERKDWLQRMERRNDRTQGIERREWLRLSYGGDHFEAEQSTVAAVRSIGRDDLRAFHRRWWTPASMIIAVSGDITPERALEVLDSHFASWPAGEKVPEVPKPTQVPPTGVRVVNKDDVNQTRVSIGHLATTWDDPNAFALQVMNHVLGGSGFTSRVTKRVRSDEGLAYSAGSGIGFGWEYPRTLRVVFQSRNEAVPRGIALCLEEMRRIREEPITAEERETAIESFVEQFPRRFQSASGTASVFVDDELRGRPADWWETYRDRMRAVTVADVQRVAKEYLHPDRAAILVIGKIDEVMAGDPDHPDYQLTKFAGPEGVLEIPLPDPESLVYPHDPRPWSAGAMNRTPR